MMQPRGTTISISYRPAADRKAPWCASWNVYVPGRTGRPRTRTAWFNTEAEAEEFKQRTLAARPAVAPVQPVTPPTHRAADSLAAFAEQVWLPFVKGRNAGGTHKNYAYAFTHWVAPQPKHKRYPGIGNVVLSAETLTRDVVITYLEDLFDKGVSLSMRRRLKTAISACCGHALYVGRLKGVNPCSEVGRRLRHKGEEEQERPPNPFSGDETTRIFDQLRAVEDLCWQVYFLWQFHVGTRPGEATALKWTSLDLEHNKAKITHAYCTVDQIDKDPKTHEKRTVDLTATLVELLIEWRRVQREVAFSRGLKQPEYVFTTRLPARGVTRELTRIIQGGSVNAVLRRTLVACKIDGHTLYDFRDSFATSHLLMGWDRKLAWVSKQLGHKTPMTTSKHYYSYRDTRASALFADEIGGWK